MRAFINRQLSYGVKNKITSEGALSILFKSHQDLTKNSSNNSDDFLYVSMTILRPVKE